MAKKKTHTLPKAKPTPTRFRNPLSKYRVRIDAACDNCGKCVRCCPYGVFRKGARRPKVIGDHLCLGPACEKEAFCCVSRCHVKAIKIAVNPSFEMLGDRRWTAELLASSWYMAETGKLPYQGLNYKTGDSGGGFDKIRFVFPKENGQGRTRRSLVRGRAEPLTRRPAERAHTYALLPGRHVFRLHQHRFHALQGKGGCGPRHLLLHGRRRLPGRAGPVRGPHYYAGRDGPLRGKGRDDQSASLSWSSSTPRGQSRDSAATSSATR